MILNIAHIHSSTNKGVCTGHYLPLADLYYNLFNKYCDVRICGGHHYAERFKDRNVLLLPNSIDVYSSSVDCLLRMLKNACYLFKHTKGQIVILQDGKPVANHICVLLFYKKCNLYLIKYHVDGVDKLWKKILFSFIKHRIKGIICPNDDIGIAHGLPYCVVPDYIYTGNGIPNSAKLYSEKKYDFSCLGRIEPEKGIVEVVKKLKGTPYSLLVAGNPNPSQLASELQEICKDAPNIELRLGYLSDEDYEEALQASRYALLNYQGVYANRSSGVVFDMLFHGVPVIGHKSAALNFVAENGVGYLYDDISKLNPSELLNEEKHAIYLSKIKEYCHKHEAYKNKLVDFLGINNQ